MNSSSQPLCVAVATKSHSKFPIEIRGMSIERHASYVHPLLGDPHWVQSQEPDCATQEMDYQRW